MSAFKSVEEAMASLNVQKTAEEVRAEAGVYEIKTTNDIAAPTNLRVVDRTHNTITLKWNAKLSEEPIKVESIELQMRAVDVANTYFVEDFRSLTSIIYTNYGKKKNLKPGIKYTFRVRKCQLRMEKCSEFSEPVECMVVDPGFKQLKEPTLKAADAISCTLEWEEVSGCEGYRLRYRIDDKDSEKEEWQEIETLIQNNTVRKKGLKSNVFYVFEVKPMGVIDGSEYVFSPSSSPMSTINLAPHVTQVLPRELISRTGKVNTNERLGGKVIALYFSAHWCGPCRAFTPKLANFYHSSENKKQYQMEVVFVSCDHNEEDFDKYYQTMPWLAVPYDAPQREHLQKGFNVSGIPRMVIISPSGQTVCENATNFNLNSAILETWGTDLRR